MKYLEMFIGAVLGILSSIAIFYFFPEIEPKTKQIIFLVAIPTGAGIMLLIPKSTKEILFHLGGGFH